MLLRPTALFLALILCGCGASEAEAPPPDESQLPPIPFCHDEMIAYVELTRLARAQGDGWTVFLPAMTALREQIVDCVDDADAHFHELRLSPPPLLPPIPPEPCGADCASERSGTRRPL